jgi:shikimate dehydrogenase
MNINKDTKLYGSFSQQAGNKGCEFFNAAFEKHGINAIYKSFSVNNIEDTFKAAITLKMAGFAVAMPFKIKMYDILTGERDGGLFTNKTYGSINTVIRHDKDPYDIFYCGYNTDFIGVKQILKERKENYDNLIIIGNGGLAKSVKAAWGSLNAHSDSITVITKNQTNILKHMVGALIYNCSPGDYSFLSDKNNYIDCRIGTPDGDKLHSIQAKAQFKLYTGIDYE